MKLIDKDKLPLTHKQGTYIGGGVYDGEGYYVDGNEVANAPIIDAIPVEWIEKWMKNELYIDIADVTRMLNDWKKTKKSKGMRF